MHTHRVTLRKTEIDRRDEVVVYEGEGVKIECGCTIGVETYRMPYSLYEKLGEPEAINITVLDEDAFDFNEIPIPKML